jgi:S-phase kinase-associated protein 1
VKEKMEIILSANYLDIPGLLNIGCKRIALDLYGKNEEEIRAYFNITHQFTTEEIDAVRTEIETKAKSVADNINNKNL